MCTVIVPEIEEGETIALGAEARTYAGKYLGYDVVVKHRFPKTYRAEQIDTLLRKNRSIQEVRLLVQARMVGVNVPFVLDIDKKEWKISQQRIFGSPLKDSMEDDIARKFKIVGQFMATLHNNNIIHGDLTTSNIIVDKNDDIWFIDFGLGFISAQIEDMAVDVLVLKHTLRSSHFAVWKEAMEAFLEGYRISNNFKSILKRMGKVENRIRYSH